MAIPRHLRPFHEAAIAYFNQGAPVILVSKKFSGVVSYATVMRWYQRWAELKGIPRDTLLVRKGPNERRKPRWITETMRRESPEVYGKMETGAPNLKEEIIDAFGY